MQGSDDEGEKKSEHSDQRSVSSMDKMDMDKNEAEATKPSEDNILLKVHMIGFIYFNLNHKKSSLRYINSLEPSFLLCF